MLFSVPRYISMASCLLSALALAHPTEQSAEDALARLEKRAGCSNNNCYNYFNNANPAAATSYCQSYIASTASTVTITAIVTATSTPPTPLATLTSGTTTVTSNVVCTITVPNNNKRAATTKPFAEKASSSCTSTANAPVTARISSACKCILTTATVTVVTPLSTVTASSTTTLPTPNVQTVATVFASTATTSVCTSTVFVNPPPPPPVDCSNIGSQVVSNGRTFNTQCNYDWGYQTQTQFINTVQGVYNYKQCLDICAGNQACTFFDFVRAPYNYCTLLSGNVGGSGWTYGDAGSLA